MWSPPSLLCVYIYYVLTAILLAAFQGAVLVNWTRVGDFNDFCLILEKDKSTQCMCVMYCLGCICGKCDTFVIGR